MIGTRLVTWLTKPLLHLFVEANVQPSKLDSLNIDPHKPVLYALKNRSLSNVLVLDQQCKRLGLPRPTKGFHYGSHFVPESYFYLTTPTSRFNRKPVTHSLPKQLTQAAELIAAEPDSDNDIQIVPVSILWGRIPDKELSLIKLMFSDNWSVPGRFRKLLIILTQGRDTLVNISEPISLRHTLQNSKSKERAVRKISRVLRVHFRRLRETIIGPDLSHRNTIVNKVLKKPHVQQAILDTLNEKPLDDRKKARLKTKLKREARHYAEEIAADYTHSVIRIYETVLTWLWNKLYNGIQITGWERLQKVATDNVVIYVPSHRSHIDYLLLSYGLFTNNLVPPHIAAGVNLNLPVVGPLLRRAGAFFLRRSFKGNPLYAAVFNEYLNEVFDRGFSVEYFIEGGRSRTGRMLQPRPGMLAMTVRSFLRTRRRKFVFIPIYFGYEKVLEGGSYVGELHGKAKKKESVFGIFKTLRQIRGTFGQVHVNFGEPIHLNTLLDNIHPGWENEPYDDNNPPEWLNPAVTQLGQQIITHINDAAVVNPVSLISQVLLATNNLAMDERRLIQQLDIYLHFIRHLPYSEVLEVTPLNGREILKYCEEMDILIRHSHPMGDVIAVSQEKAVLLTYFRNNNLHLYALPSLLARLLINNRRVEAEELKRITLQVYPFLRSELFLNIEPDQLPTHIDAILANLEHQGLLKQHGDEYWSPSPNSHEYLSLATLANLVRQTLERYYITVDILRRTGSGKITREQLENRCHLVAQRMSLLYEFSAPEFFDKALFRNFLQTMITNGSIEEDPQGKILFDKRLTDSIQERYPILTADVRDSIQQVAYLESELEPEVET